jgi:MFS family permease
VPASSTSAEVPRWLLSIAVMLSTVMVILDMTIVNVALPHMMGSLGATADQITWVLTGYIVMEAIVIPLSGFLGKPLPPKLQTFVDYVLSADGQNMAQRAGYVPLSHGQ